MAFAVVSVAATMAVMVLSSSARSAIVTRQGDAGTSVAAAALQSAALLDCGTTTAMLPSGAGDMTNPASPVPGVFTARLQGCAPAAKGAIGDLGDVRWTETSAGVTFSVAMRTNWVTFDPKAPSTTSGSTISASAVRLRRDIVVTWQAAGRTRTRRLSQLAAPPPDDITGTFRGTLTVARVAAVAGQPGTATIDLGSGFRVTHSADAFGVVRFPFLALNTPYPLAVNGLARTTVVLTPDRPDVTFQP